MGHRLSDSTSFSQASLDYLVWLRAEGKLGAPVTPRVELVAGGVGGAVGAGDPIVLRLERGGMAHLLPRGRLGVEWPVAARLFLDLGLETLAGPTPAGAPAGGRRCAEPVGASRRAALGEQRVAKWIL